MANNIQYSNAFGGYTISTTEQTDGSHALNVVMAQLPMRDTNVFYGTPVGGSTNLAMVGGAIVSTGTITTAIVPGAANYTRFRRTRMTGTAVGGNAAADQMGYTRWFRGDNGGFDALIQFGQAVDTTGYSAFVGMSTLTVALAAVDPTTFLNCVGVGYTSTDAAGGTWFLIYNDGAGTATKTAITGMTRDATSGYNLRITCPPGASANITVTITNAHTGAVILPATVLTTDLLASGTTVGVGVNQYNGAVAASAVMDVSRIYVSCTY
jgi:hypothetical protein